MKGKNPRRPRAITCYALVTRCVLRTKSAVGDVWAGRRHMFVTLTCGHEVLRTGFRRFLVGERIRCAECEKAAAVAQLPLPMHEEART